MTRAIWGAVTGSVLGRICACALLVIVALSLFGPSLSG